MSRGQLLPWHLASVTDKQHIRIHVVNISHSPGHKDNSRAATEWVELRALLDTKCVMVRQHLAQQLSNHALV